MGASSPSLKLVPLTAGDLWVSPELVEHVELMGYYHRHEYAPEMMSLFEMIKNRGIGNTSVDDVLEVFA